MIESILNFEFSYIKELQLNPDWFYLSGTSSLGYSQKKRRYTYVCVCVCICACVIIGNESANTVSTVLVPWAGHAKILIYFSNKIYGCNFIKHHSETVMV